MSIKEKTEKIDKLFSKDIELPTLPSIYLQLKDMMEAPFVSNKKIAGLIINDQAIVTKIIRLSNSALYTKSKEIKDLSVAIS